MECSGQEANLLECKRQGWGNFESCANNQIAGVICGSLVPADTESGGTSSSIDIARQYGNYPCERCCHQRGWTCHATLTLRRIIKYLRHCSAGTSSTDGDLRIQDGPVASSGRLEVCRQGQWGR